MLGLIYALADPRTNEIRYCGKTTWIMSQRLANHRREARNGAERHVCRWIKSLLDVGLEPVAIRLEEVALDGMDSAEQIRRLNKAETRWIARLRKRGCDLTNATNGGDGAHGTKLSPERREKLLASTRGKPRTKEWCAAISEGIRRTRKERPYPTGDAHPNWGRKLVARDPEARSAKMRTALQKPERIAQLAQQNAKLSHESVMAIYLSKDKTKALCQRYNISPNVIRSIRRGAIWRHITGAVSPD